MSFAKRGVGAKGFFWEGADGEGSGIDFGSFPRLRDALTREFFDFRLGKRLFTPSPLRTQRNSRCENVRKCECVKVVLRLERHLRGR